jgi:hypothetical protein
MARIEFKWEEPKLDAYDGVNPDDFYTALPDTYKSREKPLLVFLTSDAEEDAQEMKNVEAMLMDENVAIGATLFKQIKLKAGKFKDGSPYWKSIGGKDAPRMVVFDTTGARIGSAEGKDCTASKVFGLMKRAASKTYKVDIEAVVKETKSILTEIDQIEAKRKALETRKANSNTQKETEWAKEAKTLDEQMKAVEAREAALHKKWNEDRKVTKA